MPPSKSETPRRNTEQHIQGWFAFAEVEGNPDLEAVQYFNALRNKGWSPKRIIGEGIIALKRSRSGHEEEAQIAPSVTDKRFEQLFALLDQLTRTIASAGVHLDPAMQAAVVAAQEQGQEYTALEESLAGRYTSFRFDEEPEGE